MFGIRPWEIDRLTWDQFERFVDYIETIGG